MFSENLLKTLLFVTHSIIHKSQKIFISRYIIREYERNWKAKNYDQTMSTNGFIQRRFLQVQGFQKTEKILVIEKY